VTRLPNLETLFNSSFLTPPPSLKPWSARFSKAFVQS
jgi:hypothetical protein